MITITEAHLTQVVIVASTMRIPPELKPDAIQCGYVGLLQAAERFDPDAGAQFRTFAERRIRGAIQDFLRDSDSLSRRHRKAVQRGETHPIRTVELTPPMGRRIKCGGLSMEEAIDDQRRRAWLHSAIARLPAQNRQAVQLALAGLRCRPIGEVMGVCESRASQLITGAVRMMAAQRPALPPRPLP